MKDEKYLDWSGIRTHDHENRHELTALARVAMGCVSLRSKNSQNIPNSQNVDGFELRFSEETVVWEFFDFSETQPWKLTKD